MVSICIVPKKAIYLEAHTLSFFLDTWFLWLGSVV